METCAPSAKLDTDLTWGIAKNANQPPTAILATVKAPALSALKDSF